MIFLSKAQQYFDDLIIQGYSEKEALVFTQKYYPGFFLPEVVSKDGKASAGLELKSEKLDNPYVPSKVGEESFVEKYGPKAKIVVDSTVENAKMLIEKLPLNRKTAVAAYSVVLILVISVIAFLIPASTEPINGTWIKSDGQRLSFDSNGDYDDESSFDSTWYLEDNDLTITSSGTVIYSDGSKENIQVVQTIDVYFSDDENALWLDFVSVQVNGEEQNPDSQQCVLILKSSIAKNILQYSNEYSQYIDESPKQCV